MAVRLFVFLAALACSPSFARAQAAAGAQSTLIDTSIRASGMGRAGVAVFWGGDPNQWVGYHQGIRYNYGKTQLVPDLASNVFFRSKVLTVGGFGVGAYMAGKPAKHLGSLRLDYGTNEATDVDGNVIGVFTSFEEIEAFGFGVSVAELMEHLLRVAGVSPPPISRSRTSRSAAPGRTWPWIWRRRSSRWTAGQEGASRRIETKVFSCE